MTQREMLALIASIYMNHPSGGYLHIILDDGNVTDVDVALCLRVLRQESPKAQSCGLCVKETDIAADWYQNPAYTFAHACRDCYAAQERCLLALQALPESRRAEVYEVWGAIQIGNYSDH